TPPSRAGGGAGGGRAGALEPGEHGRGPRSRTARRAGPPGAREAPGPQAPGRIMMSALLGATVVLASFFLASALLSAMVAAATPAVLAPLNGARPSVRGPVTLALRLLPSGAALFVAAGLVAPSYVFFEPPDTGERVSAVLCGLAGLGLALILLGLVRGTRA